MSFYKYLDKIKQDHKKAVKIEWLNPDETVNFEFTNALYNIDVNVDVNYQNGCRRTCTLTLNNDRNRFPINFNSIWIGQKFKVWMGIYLDDETPYLFPQGVFYVSNPSEAYNPSTRTITINGVDKWAYLDGSLFGNLPGTYQTNVGVNLYDAIRELLLLPQDNSLYNKENITKKNITDFFRVNNGEDDYSFDWDKNDDTALLFDRQIDSGYHTASTTFVAYRKTNFSFEISYFINSYNMGSKEDRFDVYINDVVKLTITESEVLNNKVILKYSCFLDPGDQIRFKFIGLSDGSGYGECSIYDMKANVISTNQIDPIPPLLSSYYANKTASIPKWNEEENTYINEIVSVLDCPYTAIVERGQTYADVLLEYATILCASIYYDVNGRLVLEPIVDTSDDITDTNKEILWDYTIDEKTFLGLSQTYNFDKVYNDFIVLGNIVNGYQFKGRVQNLNPLSNTSVQRIGLRTKPPKEDNQYVSDEQCIELAKYDAKIDTILQKSGNISSITLYHLDVNKLVTVSTPNNSMSKELFLITGFSLSSSGTMSVNVTSINILKDFSVVEADVYE